MDKGQRYCSLGRISGIIQVETVCRTHWVSGLAPAQDLVKVSAPAQGLWLDLLKPTSALRSHQVVNDFILSFFKSFKGRDSKTCSSSWQPSQYKTSYNWNMSYFDSCPLSLSLRSHAALSLCGSVGFCFFNWKNKDPWYCILLGCSVCVEICIESCALS